MMRVQVVLAQPEGMQQEMLELAPGSVLADALAKSHLAAKVFAQHGPLAVGIWNHVRPPETPLQDGDRIELYKPLLADPKEARRARVERSREEAQKKKAAARKVTAA
jgi:uncharacterized protein